MLDLIMPSTAILNAVTSTAVESPYATWAAVTTYAKGDIRIYGRRLYESQKDSNTGNPPDAVVATNGTVWWVDLGPSNKNAMLDEELNSATTATGSLVITATGPIDSLALLSLKGVARVDTVVTRNGQVLRSFSKTLRDDTNRRTFKGWFFSPITFRSEHIQFGLPTVYDGVTTVTLTASNPQATLSVGKFVVGRTVQIGAVRYEPVYEIKDWSTDGTDGYGRPKVMKRGFGKVFQVNCQFLTDRFDLVNKSLTQVASVPVVVVVAGGRWDTLISYGLVSFRSTLKNLKRSYCAISMKGYI